MIRGLITAGAALWFLAMVALEINKPAPNALVAAASAFAAFLFGVVSVRIFYRRDEA